MKDNWFIWSCMEMNDSFLIQFIVSLAELDQLLDKLNYIFKN